MLSIERLRSWFGMQERDRKREARFELLLNAADRTALGFSDLRELAHLYRVESARLSRLRARENDPEAVRYLNGLCRRAYVHVYTAPAGVRVGAGFWLRGLPRALARTAGLQLLAMVLLAIGTLAGAALVLEDAANLSATVPARMYDPGALEELQSKREARREFLERRPVAIEHNTFFAGSLFAHNTRVGLLSFAVGILAGLPTLLLLLYNGLTLGGFSTVFLRDGPRLEFVAWIVPHAIPELLAIVLCSAGGLAMGLAVIAPGRVGRSQALRSAAGDAFLLLGAAVPLFVTAALIESFVRESMLSTTARMSVATLVAILLCAYVLSVKRHAGKRYDPIELGALERSSTKRSGASYLVQMGLPLSRSFRCRGRGR
jgi:uncharacterized membrane protein SpoIIM required for sporulation